MLGDGAVPAAATGRPAAKKGLKATRKTTRKKVKKRSAKRTSSKRTNWNAVLGALPASFTAAQVKQAAGNTSNDADVHQALLRWRKAGKVTNSARGQYKKV